MLSCRHLSHTGYFVNYPAVLDQWPRKTAFLRFRRGFHRIARRKYHDCLARLSALPEYLSYTVGIWSVLDDSLSAIAAGALVLMTLAVSLPFGWLRMAGSASAAIFASTLRSLFRAIKPESARAMRRARLRAERADASKSLFLAVLSHEIRTLLYGMLASIELIGKTRLDDAQAQLAAAMSCSARTLKDVLNNTLDFTRNESEALQIAHREFDLCHTIESTVKAFGARAAQKGLQLHCRIDPALAGAWWGDSLKLMQILNNLLNNAVKFTERGCVTVTAELNGAGNPDDANRRTAIALSVRDTGPGIAGADIERIFRLFGRARNGKALPSTSGAGLGLYISKQFATAMGGAIDLISPPAGGSIFTLRLALQRGDASAATAETAAPSIPAASTAAPPFNPSAIRRKSDPKILVVDDQPINRMLLEKQLCYLGCQVTLAADGPEALTQETRFDLILTDLNLPGLDGYALARAWRDGGAACPIVAVSADPADDERERCVAAGIDGYLTKPFTMDELERMLTRHLGARPSRRAAHRPDGGWQRWEPDTMRIVVASLTSDLGELADCAAAQDVARLGRVVHRIHGGMALLEMRPAAALCRTIEECIEFEWEEESLQLAPALREMLAQIRDDIDPGDPAD